MPRTTRSGALLVAVILILSAGAPFFAAAASGAPGMTEQSTPMDLTDRRQTASEFDVNGPRSVDATTNELVSFQDAFDDGNPLPMLLLLGYSRYDDSSPLENDVRRRVFEHIERSPGVHVSALAEVTDASRSTVRYHVRVLEREGLVFGEKIRGKRRFFPVGSDDPELTAALHDDATASVLDAVARIGPANVSQLAEDLDRTPGTVSYHLSRLEAADLVEQEREGGSVLTRLTGTARAHMDDDTVERVEVADD